MNSPPTPVIGRLGPSPTGALHVGHARTFLAAWLAARGVGGTVTLRVEDLDAGRVRPGASQGAIDDLRWLGLDWDEGPDVGGPRGPYTQSERAPLYEAALGRLAVAELVYPCTCTRAEVARAASAPHEGEEGPSYPGTCAARSASEAAALGDRPYAWRFRVPEGFVSWDDRFLGPQSFEPSRTGGDFIVARNGAGPSYQLAVALDDALMRVTQVVRGADLVPSTPRQILLLRALGFRPPSYGHLPFVVDEQGRRLAKRDGSIKLATLRSQGIVSEALIGTLARSLGLDVPGGRATPRELVGRLDPWLVPPDPWAFLPGALRG